MAENIPSNNLLDPTVFDALKNRLLGENNIVSSAETPIEATIKSTITGLETAQTKREAGVKAAAERARLDVQQVGTERLTAAREEARGLGPASTMALINRQEEQTTKSLRDLDLRETEALASGQIEVAGQLANLKIQELKFRTEARQSAFDNLLKVSAFGINLEQEQRLAASAKREESSAIAGIALKYGITIEPGDTITTITQRAAPRASASQKLEDQKTVAEINKLNAEAAKARGEAGGAPTSAIISFIADGYANQRNPQAAVLESKMDAATKRLVLGELTQRAAPHVWSATESDTFIMGAKNGTLTDASGNTIKLNLKQLLQEIDSDPKILNKEEVKAAAQKAYGGSATGGGAGTPFTKTGVEKAKTAASLQKEQRAATDAKRVRDILIQGTATKEEREFLRVQRLTNINLSEQERKDALNIALGRPIR